MVDEFYKEIKIMKDYLLKLEFNAKDYMIFSFQHGSAATAIILLEDLNRPGDLMKDFSYLVPKYFSKDDDKRNLVYIRIFPIFEKSRVEGIEEEISHIAGSIIEDTNINIRVEWIWDKDMTSYYQESDEKKREFMNYVLSFCENKEEIGEISEDYFHHLRQSL